MTNRTELMAAAGFGLGLAAIGAAFMAVKKIGELNKALSNAVSKIEDGIEVDISDDLVKEATDRAVTKAASNAATSAVAAVRNEFASEIRSEVRHAVEAEKSSLRSDIKEQIKKEIGYIDISEAKKEVIEKASEEALEKFKSDLDAILVNHNKELEQIQKIYGNIANTLKGGIA